MVIASRTLIGGMAGAVLGILWYTLGTSAVLVALGLGAVGLAIGWVFDNPGRVAEMFRRLERP